MTTHIYARIFICLFKEIESINATRTNTLLIFPVVFLKITTFLGVFENIIGCFSILQPKTR
jgi:hypothetical protein